jgi:hypothetical protein
MKYALLIYDNPAHYEGWSDDDRQAITGEYFAIRDAPGVYDGFRLQPMTTTTTVRVNGSGEALTTDGPFADTKEVLGGLFLLEADDIDQAIEVAARIPAARHGGGVEIRPVVEK